MPMSAVKSRISVTIIPQLAQLIDELAKAQKISKSAVVEKALRALYEARLAEDAEKIASITFDDLPTEDEWAQIQSEY